MIIKTRGLILSQRRYRERERYLSILTEDCGLIEAKLRIFGQINQHSYHAIGVLGYYAFDLYFGRQRYTVNAAEKLENFYALREDVSSLALGEYFCELTAWLKPEAESAKECLSFLLNSLYWLKEKRSAPALLKAVYEWRILCETGFMPNLIGCASCGAYTAPKMYFVPMEGALYCEACRNKTSGQLLPLTQSCLQAMRYVALKSSRELFGFTLSGKSLESFAYIAEQYMTCRTEKQFKTLEVYRQMERCQI